MTGLRGHRLVLAHALASVGMSLPWPALLAGVWATTGDSAVLGVAGAARMAPYVLCSWWVARAADRWDRAGVVRVSMAGRAVLLAVAALLLQGGAEGQRLLLAVLACTGAIAAGTPAYPALVGGLAGPAHERTTAWVVVVEVSSFVVGPAVGGLLLGRVSTPTVLALSAVLCAVAWGVMRGRTLSVATPDPEERAAGGVLRVLRSSARVRGAIAAICVVNLVAGTLAVALVPIAEQEWGSTQAYGAATAAFGFGALATPMLARLGRTPVRRVHLGMAIFGGCLLAVAFGAWPLVILSALALGGAAATHAEAAATAVLQVRVPDRQRATVLGITDAAMVSAAMLGSFAGPVLVGRLGAHVVLLGLAVGTALAGVLALPTVARGLEEEHVAPAVP